MVQVTTTVGAEADAARLAGALVEARLAACVQIAGPITSTYRWEGAVTSASEWLVVAKVPAAAADTVVARVVDLHPYDVPEVLVTPVLGGHGPYLEWVAAAATAPSDAEHG